MKKYPIVEITWVDSQAQYEMLSLDEIGELSIIKSCGYLVKSSNYKSEEGGGVFKTQSVAQEIHDDGRFRDVTTIPVANIIIVKIIEDTK